MAEEIDFDFGHLRQFDGPVTLTLASDDLVSHIVAHILSTSTNITYWLVATLRLTDKVCEGQILTFDLIYGSHDPISKIGHYAIVRTTK